uniref:Sulfatase N-terminal domain-containing protein n=1 Tax=Spongospora subterranea TaxID=70186 RepID=A0A0H5R9S5_9EUKA|eukprot:CRZ10838.1 hypothetical protein [Spongospora subterranea]
MIPLYRTVKRSTPSHPPIPRYNHTKHGPVSSSSTVKRSALPFIHIAIMHLAIYQTARLITLCIQAQHMPAIRPPTAILAAIVAGSFQDLAITLQTIIILTLPGFPSNTLVGATFLPPLIDIATQLCGYPRITFSELALVWRHFGQFTTSFMDVLTTWRSLVCLGAYLTYVVCMGRYIRARSPVILSSLMVIMLVITTLFTWNIAVMVRYFLPWHVVYVADNTNMAMECGLLASMGLTIFRPQYPTPPTLSSVIPYEDTIKSVLGPNEIYTLLSSPDQFPFYRTTIGFTGKRHFTVHPAPAVGETRLPNIIIINMESWAHHVVGAMVPGTPPEASLTPEFDRLSDQGILYTSYYSPGSQTSRSLLTHLYSVKPIFDHEAALQSRSRTLHLLGLPDLLQAHGYHNEFISGTDLSWHDWNWFLLHHGFDNCIGRYDIPKLLRDMGVNPSQYEQSSWGLHDDATMMLLEKRAEQLNKEYEEGGKPFMIDYLSISSHSPFLVPKDAPEQNGDQSLFTKDSNGQTSSNYKRSIHYSDYCLGRMIKSMRKKAILNTTMIIIQGDHGRGKDHRLGGNPELHMVDLLDDFQRIPLLIIPPSGSVDAESLGKRIDQVSVQYDLMATITDMLNMTMFEQHGVGQSLVRIRPDDRRIILDNPINGFDLIAAVDDRFKYVFSTVKNPLCVYDRLLDKDEVFPTCHTDSDAIYDSSERIRQARIWVDHFRYLTQISYDKGSFLPINT